MKTYGAVFGGGLPSANTGLTPTFIVFANALDGSAVTPPGITEIIAGGGFYRFQYGPTVPIFWVMDGGAALSSSVRYVSGNLDPIQAVDESVGLPSASFGDDVTDPTTVMGLAKRLMEFLEGNQEYLKATGVWNIYSRGSSTLLREKTLSNDTTEVTRE